MAVVERTEVKTFTPVIITLESQLEVDVLKSILGRVVSHGLDENFTYSLYNELSEYVSHSADVTATGTVHLESTVEI